MATKASRILIVDDEARTCQLTRTMLTKKGYTVDVANDGHAALQHIARHRYDFAILDYRMPAMDGVELFRRIHRQQPHVVGVFLTGYPTIDTVFPAIDAGVLRVLSKPLDAHELLAVLNECMHDPVTE